jgi:hypothetical protein
MKLRRDQLPLYFEGLQLRRWLTLAGWPLAMAAAAIGVTFAGMARSPLVTVVGLLLGVLAALLIAGLVRCRRCEVVVGGRVVTATVGPLRRRAPVGWLERGELRRARSWRRLYADQELAFELADREQSFILPTAEPEALRDALAEARTAARTQSSG